MDAKALKQLEEILNRSLHAQEERLSKIFATKDDLRRFATKDDLRRFATKDDLRNLVTKDDLLKFREEITEDISSVMMEFINHLDDKKADKKQVSLLDARITRVESKISA